MILATIRGKDKRNGELVLVSSDHTKAVRTEGIATTLIEALQNWGTVESRLKELSMELNELRAKGIFDFDLAQCLAPLPNAPGFYDGSAFLSHVVRARKSRGDEMPESARKTPLMYQGVSDNLLPYNAPLELVDSAYGGDFEGEFAVVMKDTPRGVTPAQAEDHFALFLLFNDITYREIVKQEIVTKFGFLQSKPNSSFAPLAVTPDELEGVWKNGRLTGAVEVKLNGERFGDPDGQEMNFSFGELVAHAARTRPLSAGSIVGTGTVSNEDKARGFACLTEKRFQEILDDGKPSTEWLKVGDHIQMDYRVGGKSIFGPIDQKVVLRAGD